MGINITLGFGLFTWSKAALHISMFAVFIFSVPLSPCPVPPYSPKGP